MWICALSRCLAAFGGHDEQVTTFRGALGCSLDGHDVEAAHLFVISGSAVMSDYPTRCLDSISEDRTAVAEGRSAESTITAAHRYLG